MSTERGSTVACHMTCQAGQTHVTFHLRGAYGPSMSQMFAEKYCTDDGWRRLPRAPLHSHAEYLDFCRCLLDDEDHQRWHTILQDVALPHPDDWVLYAAQYATLPLLSRPHLPPTHTSICPGRALGLAHNFRTGLPFDFLEHPHVSCW